MNSPLTAAFAAARGTAAAPKLSVTILYECLDSGKQAKRLTDQLASEEDAHRALELNLWSFRVLGARQFRNDSVGTATVADLVILSMSGKSPLPSQVEAWVEMWTWLIDGQRKDKPAVVALFAAPATEGARIRAYLRRAAVSKGLKFFPHTLSVVDDAPRDENSSLSAGREVAASGAGYRQFFRNGAVMADENALWTQTE